MLSHGFLGIKTLKKSQESENRFFFFFFLLIFNWHPSNHFEGWDGRGLRSRTDEAPERHHTLCRGFSISFYYAATGMAPCN